MLRKIGLVDILKDIVYLICLRKFFEMLKKGEIVDIIIKWDIILFFFFFNIDEMWKIIEKCLLESLDKVKEF